MLNARPRYLPISENVIFTAIVREYNRYLFRRLKLFALPSSVYFRHSTASRGRTRSRSAGASKRAAFKGQTPAGTSRREVGGGLDGWTRGSRRPASPASGSSTIVQQGIYEAPGPSLMVIREETRTRTHIHMLAPCFRGPERTEEYIYSHLIHYAFVNIVYK